MKYLKDILILFILLGFVSLSHKATAPNCEPEHYETLRPITAMLSPLFNPATPIPYQGVFKALDMLEFSHETKQRAEWEFQAGICDIDTVKYDIYWMPIDGSSGRVRWNITQSDIGFGGNYDFPGSTDIGTTLVSLGAPFIVYRTRISILTIVDRRHTVHVILERDSPSFQDTYPQSVYLIGVLAHY